MTEKANYSPLPPAIHLAERIRRGEDKAAIAAEAGVSVNTLNRKLRQAGWNGDGTVKAPEHPPKRPASEATLTDDAALRTSPDLELPCQINPDAWFPDSGWRPDFIREIKSGCTGMLRGERVGPECPIREKCLEYAIARPDIQHGIWGGYTARQIKRIRARRRGGYAA